MASRRAIDRKGIIQRSMAQFQFQLNQTDNFIDTTDFDTRGTKPLESRRISYNAMRIIQEEHPITIMTPLIMDIEGHNAL